MNYTVFLNIETNDFYYCENSLGLVNGELLTKMKNIDETNFTKFNSILEIKNFEDQYENINLVEIVDLER